MDRVDALKAMAETFLWGGGLAAMIFVAGMAFDRWLLR